METEDKKTNEIDRDLWPKIRRIAASVPGVSDVLALYFYLKSGHAPIKHKASIIFTLAYFILPFDAIPDFLGPLGYTDDLAVALGMITFIGSDIMNPYRAFAKEWLRGGRTADSLDEAIAEMNKQPPEP